MVFFDLNIPVEDEATKNRKTNKDSKGKKVKLVVKAMELGYSGIAYNRVISGVIADADRCTTTPLPLSSLLQAAPSLAKSVRFHREVLGVPVGAPFRQYTRVTVVVESMVQAVVINPGNSVLRSYDLVAVRPMDQKTFEHACNHLEVDLISIDFSQKLPFHMKLPLIKAAIERGIFFEIMYSPAISNSHARRDTFATVKLLVDRTRGRNIIVSSAASKVNELRGPYDVANMSTLFGLSLEHAKAAVSKNCRSVLLHALTQKKYHKSAIHVENCPPDVIVGSGNAWLNVSEVWDPIASGEGDLILETNLVKNVSTNNNGPVISSMKKTHQPYAKEVSESSSHNRDLSLPDDNKIMSARMGLFIYGTPTKENNHFSETKAIRKPITNIMILDSDTSMEELKSSIHEPDAPHTTPVADNGLSFSNGIRLSALNGHKDQLPSNSIKGALLHAGDAFLDGYRLVTEPKLRSDKKTIPQLSVTNCDANIQPAKSRLGNTSSGPSFTGDKSPSLAGDNGPLITEVDTDFINLLNEGPSPSLDSKGLVHDKNDAICTSFTQVKVPDLIRHDINIIGSGVMVSSSDIKMEQSESRANEMCTTGPNTCERILVSDDALKEEAMPTMSEEEPVAFYGDDGDNSVQMELNSKTCRGSKMRRKRLDRIYSSSLRDILKPALFKRKVQTREKMHIANDTRKKR